MMTFSEITDRLRNNNFGFKEIENRLESILTALTGQSHAVATPKGDRDGAYGILQILEVVIVEGAETNDHILKLLTALEIVLDLGPTGAPAPTLGAKTNYPQATR